VPSDRGLPQAGDDVPGRIRRRDVEHSIAQALLPRDHAGEIAHAQRGQDIPAGAEDIARVFESVEGNGSIFESRFLERTIGERGGDDDGATHPPERGPEGRRPGRHLLRFGGRVHEEHRGQEGGCPHSRRQGQHVCEPSRRAIG
jgi:hypothetical protein